MSKLFKETHHADEPWKKFIDNQPCIAIAHGTGYNGRAKHIELCYLAIEDIVYRRTMELEYCSNDESAADVMTK